MGQFVKQRLVWKLGHRVDSNLSLAGLCGQVSYVAQSEAGKQRRGFFNLYAT